MKALFILLLAMWSAVAFALGPHEVLVLANGRVPESVEIAEEYARLRHVPEVNIIRLDLPESMADALAMTPEEFSTAIWRPANQVMYERGLTDHILAWAYSTHFPIRIKTDPPVSIQGITFVRNELPDSMAVKAGTYVSTLFAGPHSRGGIAGHSKTLDVYRRRLRQYMPLPSMMLGYTGPRGNSKQVVIECLKRGVTADQSRPMAPVYLVTSDDVRSRAREWQFADVRSELSALGVEARIVRELPGADAEAIGLMMGVPRVPMASAPSLVPGAMAEHLTSLAAVFDAPGQTKLTKWIDAGATASAGTVTEPYAKWMKFPSARFFVHYAGGCTLLESFYQSIRCPLQILLVGEPLSAPWAPPAEVLLKMSADEPVSGTVGVRADVRAPPPFHFHDMVYLLDGRLVDKETEQVTVSQTGVSIDTRALRDGEHVLRAVAYRAGLVRSQAFAEARFTVDNSGQPE